MRAGQGIHERPGPPAGPAAAPWLRMACAALLSCLVAGPLAGALAAWPNPDPASMDGAAPGAAPGAPGRQEGATGPAREFPEAAAAAMPVAPPRPLMAAAKPPAFGPTCRGAAGSRSWARFRDVPGAGPSPAPGFGGADPGTAPARPLPWGSGNHVASACGAAGCAAAAGGRRTPAQAGSPAGERLEAPKAGRRDHFGSAVALSADGSTLAVGAEQEDSSATGASAPGDPGYQAALDSDGGYGSGAVTVYRRPGAGRWAVEAFVKAPVSAGSTNFGSAVALSADGSVLAVGAHREDSSATGAFAPGDDGYRAAVRGRIKRNHDSGAAYVYRRSVAGRWALEAFVKAPNAGFRDGFGHALALSADGSVLAVGAPYEDSLATGAFAPGDPGYQAALDSDGASDYESGAVTVYRRPPAGRWAVEAFVKAPVAGYRDYFGWALALSADGSALAVGTDQEDSSATGAFAPGDPGYQAALESEGAEDSGAVTVHRRSAAGRWALEAFVKAPVSGPGDRFGTAVALSADGEALAVGASGEGSSASGAFAPGDPGYHAALESEGAKDSGAVTVHRRSATGRWALEAFVKAPVAGAHDYFGTAVALSADGEALAVGASGKDGVAAPDGPPRVAPDYSVDGYVGDPDYAGAATVHRRSTAGRWAPVSFLNVPNAGFFDRFGFEVALSADGGTLAVGAYGEDGSDPPGTGGGGPAGARNVLKGSGAVYLY